MYIDPTQLPYDHQWEFPRKNLRFGEHVFANLSAYNGNYHCAISNTLQHRNANCGSNAIGVYQHGIRVMWREKGDNET